MTGILLWLRRHWRVFAGLAAVAVFVAGCVWLVQGARADAADRRQRSAEAAAQRARLETLANKVSGQQDAISRTLSILEEATSPATQARGAAATARAVDDLRRSIDCVGWYVLGERPPACEDVSARMDAIARGEDPFAPAAPPPPREDA